MSPPCKLRRILQIKDLRDCRRTKTAGGQSLRILNPAPFTQRSQIKTFKLL